MLSNNPRLNFRYLKLFTFFIHIIIKKKVHIPKTKQKNIYVYIHEIIRLIIMKMKMKMENRSHRYDINRLNSRSGHKSS